MTDIRAIRIHIPAGPNQDTEIEVDGHRIENAVKALRYVANAGGLHDLQLDLVRQDVTVDGVATVRLTDDVEKALIALGWTPPAGQEAP